MRQHGVATPNEVHRPGSLRTIDVGPHECGPVAGDSRLGAGDERAVVAARVGAVRGSLVDDGARRGLPLADYLVVEGDALDRQAVLVTGHQRGDLVGVVRESQRPCGASEVPRVVADQRLLALRGSLRGDLLGLRVVPQAVAGESVLLVLVPLLDELLLAGLGRSARSLRSGGSCLLTPEVVGGSGRRSRQRHDQPGEADQDEAGDEHAERCGPPVLELLRERHHQGDHPDHPEDEVGDTRQRRSEEAEHEVEHERRPDQAELACVQPEAPRRDGDQQADHRQGDESGARVGRQQHAGCHQTQEQADEGATQKQQGYCAEPQECGENPCCHEFSPPFCRGDAPWVEGLAGLLDLGRVALALGLGGGVRGRTALAVDPVADTHHRLEGLTRLGVAEGLDEEGEDLVGGLVGEEHPESGERLLLLTGEDQVRTAHGGADLVGGEVPQGCGVLGRQDAGLQLVDALADAVELLVAGPGVLAEELAHLGQHARLVGLGGRVVGLGLLAALVRVVRLDDGLDGQGRDHHDRRARHGGGLRRVPEDRHGRDGREQSGTRRVVDGRVAERADRQLVETVDLHEAGGGVVQLTGTTEVAGGVPHLVGVEDRGVGRGQLLLQLGEGRERSGVVEVDLLLPADRPEGRLQGGADRLGTLGLRQHGLAECVEQVHGVALRGCLARIATECYGGGCQSSTSEMVNRQLTIVI